MRFTTPDRVVDVVRGVSFHVDRGETLAIVGESGSGKSVTALSLLRLIENGGGQITGGQIHFRRRNQEVVDLAKAPPRLMRDLRGAELAMIFQEPMTSLNPVFTVGDQIAESIRQHQGTSRSEARAEARRMLDLVRIPDARRMLDRHPHQLSGGMRQRVMIALALACKPALLIADEPTTALDVTIQAQIVGLIRALQAELQMGVIFITHDLGLVAEVADRVAVMWRGEVVEAGTVPQVFARPLHRYTHALLAAVPRLGSMSGQEHPAKFPLVAADGETAPAVGEEHPDTARLDAPPVLRVENLVTRFDVATGIFGRVTHRVHAVESVSFDLHAGETLALVGESGCGKSTTGRSLLRLVDFQAGRVEVAGRDLGNLTRPELRAARRDIQFIFQDPFASLDPRVTIGYSIAEPLLLHGLANRTEAKERVAALLRQVGLPPEVATRYPHEFSGGQRQRICIARALALNPKIIIADEAVSALDVSIQAQIVNLFLDLQRERGIALLFISHDLAVVERIAHRVAVMYLGKIVEIGSRQAIFQNPQHPYTRKLLAAVPIADPARRHAPRDLNAEEIPSPLRPVGSATVVSPLREFAPGHLVAAD